MNSIQSDYRNSFKQASHVKLIRPKKNVFPISSNLKIG